MKTFALYEPAMCCPTGICGVAVDPELLRLSSVMHQLEKAGVDAKRFNLSGDPEAFIQNPLIQQRLMADGVEALPITLVEGEIVLMGRYPTNIEIETLLDLTLELPAQTRNTQPDAASKTPFNVFGACDPKSGCC